jgi:hypothetical protein
MRQVDWMCWWPIAYRKGMVGDLRVILKKVPSSRSLKRQQPEWFGGETVLTKDVIVHK